jgi:hypothetical protein
MRAFVRCLPLLLAIPLAGCLQVDEILTLLPDGSGKLELKVALQKSFLTFIEKMDEGRRKSLEQMRADLKDPVRLLGPTEGFTAFRPGAFTDDGQWMRGSITAFFKDVNRVRMKENRGEGWSASYSPGDLTVTNRLNELLTVFNDSIGSADGTPEQRKAALEFGRPLMASLRIRIAVSVPGEISDIEGFMTHDGVTASTTVGPEQLIGLASEERNEAARKFEELASRARCRVRWSGSPPDAERRAALKAELAEAEAKGVRPPPSSSRPAPAPAPAPPPKPRSLGEDAQNFTDDEVERLFIDAQLKVAREQIQRGQKDKARATLEGVLKDYPKAKAAQEAKTLLDGLQ